MVLVLKNFERRPIYGRVRFSARRTVDLRAQSVLVNQWLDLDLCLDILVITGACVSSRDDRVNMNMRNIHHPCEVLGKGYREIKLEVSCESWGYYP